MTKNFAPLLRYWQEWERPLKTIVNMGGAGAKLHFPLQLRIDKEEHGVSIVKPVSAICIYDALQKASSKKRGESHRLIIVIDGSFKLAAEPTPPCLMGANCSITFLSKVPSAANSLKVKMVDALHFDVENAADSTPFHPIFHAQRGVGTTREECRKVLHAITHEDVNNIEVELADDAHVLSNPYFRLPTPQLDLFAVVTMVAADYFCNPGETAKSTGVVDRFRSVLKLLTNEKNLVRQGQAAQCLNDRFFAAKNISAAHWYPEGAN